MFDTGEICPTKLALSRSKGLGIDLLSLVLRHANGNWDGLTPTETAHNFIAIDENRPVFSRYAFGSNVFLLYTNQVEGFTEIKMGDEDDGI